VLLACGVAAVVVLIVGIAKIQHVDPSIGDLKVSMDAQRSCDSVVLHTSVRLAAPDRVTFWLKRDDVRTEFAELPLTDGEQTVDIAPRMALSSGQKVQIVASATDGTRATADLDVTCTSS
jgi:hypothetical protein